MFSVQPHVPSCRAVHNRFEGAERTQVPRDKIVISCHDQSELLGLPNGWLGAVVIRRGRLLKN